MPRAFVVHGTGGSPDGNWFPWLADELEARGIETRVPAFPTPEDQRRETWLDAFAPHLPDVDRDTVFVAHSVGPAFVLNLLEREGVEARACFFVAGFTGLLGHAEFDPLNESITDREFDFDAVRDACDSFRCYHARDDPYVPVEKAVELARGLSADLVVAERGGHLNAPEYTTFPRLRDDVLRAVA